jgi:hypothetical protein
MLGVFAKKIADKTLYYHDMLKSYATEFYLDSPITSAAKSLEQVNTMYYGNHKEN